MNEQKRGVLFCHCQGGTVNPEISGQVRSTLEQLNADSIVVTDLCGLAAVNPANINGILSACSDFLVIGCYPRTMSLLMKQVAGANINQLSISYLNLLNIEPEELVDLLKRYANGNGTPSIREISEDSGWPSWYPVIDYERCTACGQCADFCLFGVYDKTPEKVTVVYPQGCKNQCPACARICPATAIIFPKYKQGGAIGGSDDIDETAEQKRQAQDTETILGNDIYLALQKRKAKRASIIRDEEMKRALNERNSALQESKLK